MKLQKDAFILFTLKRRYFNINKYERCYAYERRVILFPFIKCPAVFRIFSEQHIPVHDACIFAACIDIQSGRAQFISADIKIYVTSTDILHVRIRVSVGTFYISGCSKYISIKFPCYLPFLWYMKQRERYRYIRG